MGIGKFGVNTILTAQAGKGQQVLTLLLAASEEIKKADGRQLFLLLSVNFKIDPWTILKRGA